MAYRQLILWGRSQATLKQHKFTTENVKVKKLTGNAALTAHILSETTRDESTLTYADNGI